MLHLLLLLLSITQTSSSSPLDSFSQPISAFTHGSGLIYVPNISTVEQCAIECLTLGKGDICNSFDYNENEQICDLNLHVLSKDTKLKPSIDYVYYKRKLDTHILNAPRECPQVLPCFCDHIGTEWKNYYVIQGVCISCTCKQMRENTVCPINRSCNCNSNEVKIYKRDLNECEHCSCENEEFINHTHGVNYNHIQLNYLQLNTGGAGYIGDNGDVWKRDDYYLGGTVYRFNNKSYDIIENGTNTTVDISYHLRSKRYSNNSFGYHIPVTRRGDYIVSFYFFQLEPNTNSFQLTIDDNYSEIITVNTTGLVRYDVTLQILEPFVSFEFNSVMENNTLSEAFISSIEMTYLYPLEHIEFEEPVVCNLPNCTCPINQTVYFYQNETTVPCYDCNCIDIPVKIIERNITLINNITLPCTTTTTTTTTDSSTSTTTDSSTSTNTMTPQSPIAENPENSNVDNNNQNMSVAGIVTIVLLSVIILVFIGILIIMFRENKQIKDRNRFLEEDSTRNNINNEVSSTYSNPLFVSNQHIADNY